MDFYDKLVISITMVIVTIFCVFNSFCFAFENIDFSSSTKIDNLSFGSGDVYYHSSNPTFCCFYIKVSPEITYTLNSTQPVVFSTSQELPSDGIERYNFSTSKLVNYQITGVEYLVVRSSQTTDVYPSDILNISCDFTGLTFAVNSLVQNVGVGNMWNTFDMSLPYVLVVVGVGFGFYLIFHSIKEISKGREKMN